MPLVQDGVDEIVEGEYRLMSPANYAHAEILRRINRSGVPEVWIVSLDAETIEVRQLREGSLQRTVIAGDSNLQAVKFPGVSIPISAALWPRTP